MSAIGQGIVILRSKNNGEVTEVTCHKTLHVPKAHENLFSLTCFHSGGGHLTLVDGPMILSDLIWNQLMTVSKKNGLFYLNASTVTHDTANVTIKVKWTWTWEEWHHHLGHIGISGLRNLHGKNLVNVFSLHESPQQFECDVCIQAKALRVISHIY